MTTAAGRATPYATASLLVVLLSASAVAQATGPRAVVFMTDDSVQVHGDLYIGGSGKTDPVILLFHQAGGDARGEYGPILPRLLREGYSVLAIDQRSGGDRFGGSDRTVAALGDARATYCDAYGDLEGALDFTTREGFTGKVVAWGSSYSATLAIRLGAAHATRVAAVVAFSPAAGDPMQACQPDPYVAAIRVPLLIVRPRSEMGLEAVRRQVDLLVQYGHELCVAENGVHGSSTLVATRVNGDVEPHWRHVLTFIRTSISK